MSTASTGEGPGATRALQIPLVDLGRQYRSLKQELDAAVNEVLASGTYILTPDVSAFEQEWASYCGVPHCVGVASGTAALALAYDALELRPGDEVIAPVNTFVSTVIPLVQRGVRPVFADCDRYGQIDVGQVAELIGPRTRAVVGVDLFGHPCDADALAELCVGAGVAFVEDACQAHGAFYRGRPCGSLADIAAFSFYPTKNLGAYGEAGAVVTARSELADHVRVTRDLGQTRKYEHTLLGGNDRLDGLQAAVLRVKLPHLDRWVARRRQHARHYEHLLHGLVATPSVADCAEPAWHVFPIEVTATERDILRSELAAAGITTGVHYPVPLHLQPFLTFLDYGRGDFPVAEARARTMVSLPIFPELEEWEVVTVAEAISRLVAR